MIEIPVSVGRSGLYLEYVLGRNVPKRLVGFERYITLPSQEPYQSSVGTDMPGGKKDRNEASRRFRDKMFFRCREMLRLMKC
jgi:hypothetical protein